MSTPSFFKVYFQGAQNLSLQISVSGAANTTEVKTIVEKLQGLLTSQFQDVGVLRGQDGDNMVEKHHMPGSFVVEQRVQPTYENNPPLPDVPRPGIDHDVQMTSPPPDELYPRLNQLETTNNELEASIATLRSQVDNLQEENGKLQTELQQRLGEQADLASRLSTAMKERDDLGSQRQANLLKIRKLNDMIIKGGQNSDEPLDGDILQDMFKVRNMATDIIKRFYPNEVKFRPETAKDLTRRMNTPVYSQFYKNELEPHKTPRRRQRLLIALMFRELQSQFFGPHARRFGLPRGIEKGLQEFEKIIEGSPKVDAGETLDWRTRSVTYAVRQDFSYRETIEDCANHFATILEPMVLEAGDDKRSEKKQATALFQALFDLCTSALKLALRFRSSRTKYEFKAYADKTSLAACDEELVKKLDSEGSISKPIDPNKLYIFCTLFGALVKTRPTVSGEPGEPVVLEIGQVIVYEPQQRA